MKGLSWRYGYVNVDRVTTEQLRQIDAGTLYLTNKRLLFNGQSKNLNVQLKKIIEALWPAALTSQVDYNVADSWLVAFTRAAVTSVRRSTMTFPFRPLLAVVVLSVGAVDPAFAADRAEQPAAQVDIGKVRKFCDLGFRFTKNSIEFDKDKLLALGFKIDPKVLQALDSQAAVIVAQLTNLCRMMAAGWITPERYLEETRWLLQYAIDLQTLREKAEQASGTVMSEKPDARLNPKLIAQEELGLKLESAIETGGDLVLMLQRFNQRYLCICRAGATPAKARP